MGKKVMNDLISRSALLNAMSDTEFTTYFPLDEIYSVIDCAPAVDAEPVRHGRWKYLPETINLVGAYSCSACGFLAFDHRANKCNYCPNCGAEMRGEDGATE